MKSRRAHQLVWSPPGQLRHSQWDPHANPPPRASSFPGATERSALGRSPGRRASRRRREHPGHSFLRTNERRNREQGGGAKAGHDGSPQSAASGGLWVLHQQVAPLPGTRPLPHPPSLRRARAAPGGGGQKESHGDSARQGKRPSDPRAA